ncbi:MAG: FAD-dependent thymidylate synthase [Blastocatellia bacterium]|nr:FAD-dependent thymidylate synthase [Blastocatellia bacterium]
MSQPFLSAPPVVSLTKTFPTPFKNVVATAKTCYSSKGIIRDEDITENFEPLAQSIYQAGHHTTYQHAHFQFAIANVSRQFIWSFLHAHPFYNSEQVSQRYVAVKPDSYAIPPLSGEALACYTTAMAEQTAAYEQLTERLMPIVACEYNKLFTKHNTEDKKIRAKLRKRALECARYVLPVATFAYMYHTVSGVTLLRYYRLCNQYDTPAEQREVVTAMVQALLAHDPLYQTVLEEPLPIEETPEFAFFQTHEHCTTLASRKQFCSEFDRSLNGYISQLVDYKTNNETVLAASVREVLGIPGSAMSDAEAIALVLEPQQNRLLGESLNLTTHSKLARTLVHPNYTFRRKISHTADSQDQRHRMTPASRPVLAAHYFGEPDYITPELIRQDPEVERLYHETMERTWNHINRLLALGVSEEFALYLLPNAVSIRFTESADLANLQHKHRMRLCYLAQEEIWRASVEEARQIRVVNPLIGKHLLPPCTQRLQAKKKPICPEGDRFCGVRVWKLDLDEYQRVF